MPLRSGNPRQGEELTPPEPIVPWKTRERGGRFGNLFFLFLVRHRLLPVAYFFLFWVALYFLAAAPAARRASFDLARRLGAAKSLAARLWFALRHFFTFGTLLVDRVAILGRNADLYRFTFHEEERLRKALGEGRGAVLVTAHLGNWETLGHFLNRFQLPMTVVMHDGVQPELRETMEQLTRGKSFHVLYTDGSPATAARILAALRRGELVGMMGDRVLAGQGVEVPFLGGTAVFPTGPFALAAAAGVPLFYAFAVRERPRHYAFRASPPIELEYENARDKRKDLETWCSDFARRLEETLRRYPMQWRNLFAFWRNGQDPEPR